MTTKIIYQGGLRTEAEHLRSGTRILTDAPVDNQGQGAAFSPTDLVATALGTCVLTIMGIRARDRGLSLEGSTAEVNKIMTTDPRRIGALELTLHMRPGPFSPADKKILTAVADTCPVTKSLHPDLALRVDIHWP